MKTDLPPIERLLGSMGRISLVAVDRKSGKDSRSFSLSRCLMMKLRLRAGVGLLLLGVSLLLPLLLLHELLVLE
jgi:hypothetical protein